jgi:hypothetical protein
MLEHKTITNKPVKSIKELVRQPLIIAHGLGVDSIAALVKSISVASGPMLSIQPAGLRLRGGYTRLLDFLEIFSEEDAWTEWGRLDQLLPGEGLILIQMIFLLSDLLPFNAFPFGQSLICCHYSLYKFLERSNACGSSGIFN